MADSIDNFIDFYHGIHLPYLAGDLLDKGLSPKQISDAVLKAIKIGKSSRIEIHKHLVPVFAEVSDEILSDCKLSKLGYGLVLLNANLDPPIVGEWQISAMKAMLN